ncbi:hypothetical protein N431DRAFT_547608 [Stipitochalara longipes BDJ]|nr:hypothetical protein N431DRAFT_547608 [Stipitochalara longipes BDJ]
MPSLVIPPPGLSLGSFPVPPSKPSSAFPDVFGLTLTDVVIEEMIKCVQNGKPIQLSLGEHPNISYGAKTQHLSTSSEPFPFDLFKTSNYPHSSSSSSLNMASSKPNSNNTTKFEPKVNTRWLGNLGVKFDPTKFPSKLSKNSTKASTATSSATSATAGTDAALAALQSSLAEENAKKQGNTTKYIKDGSLPAPGRRGAVKPPNKSKFLSQNRLSGDTTRSMPSSPALSGVGSPSLGPTSVPLSQQQAEHARAARKPVIHLLAIEPMSEKELRERIAEEAQEDLMAALMKVSDLNETSKKWELRKSFFKELDVWTYEYDTTADRQRAIDNAVKQYDKMRLGVSEPQWDRLLEKSERGTGKCLSKLQAHIAAGSVARGPKINVQKADDSGRDTPNGEDDVFTDKKVSKLKGESMARSVSQPPTTKTKKISEKEAQAKRLLSKNPAKTTAKSAPVKKTPQPKPGAKVLSSEFVNDSDEEDDYPLQTKPAPKPMKRSRDEDLDTSDSSIPLSKKVKKDTPTTHRVSDASQSSRTTTSSHYSSGSSKVKGNSPQKSSPLASSPPTNASDMESTSGERTSSSESPARHPSTKNSRSPIHKRHQKSSSVSSSGSSRCLKPEVTDIARKFKMYYPKYKALHQELAAMGENRDKKKETDLRDMHARLAQMKKEIEAGIIDVDQRSE